jgi:geranylgeranyl pyrophosphate synthase
VEYSRRRAFDFGRSALEVISGLKTSEYKDSLTQLVDFILTREK